LLAAENRLTKADDFRNAFKRGSRYSTEHLVVNVVSQPSTEAASRFGFVVSKAVGGAVTRNLVKRRLRHISRELVAQIPASLDVVVRAQPGAGELPWNRLREEAIEAVTAAAKKNERR
jgi:ribonuclease P protein component